MVSIMSYLCYIGIGCQQKPLSTISEVNTAVFTQSGILWLMMKLWKNVVFRLLMKVFRLKTSFFHTWKKFSHLLGELCFPVLTFATNRANSSRKVILGFCYNNLLLSSFLELKMNHCVCHVYLLLRQTIIQNIRC